MHEQQQAFLADEAKHGSLAIFVGSGVSRGVGLPTWKELIDPLLQQLGVASSGDPLDEAQWYADAYGRPALVQHVQRALTASSTPSRMHSALAKIQAPVYLTTNYDQLMEQALEEVQGVPPDVVIDDGQVALIDEARRTTVVKLHGCLSVPETIVLTRDDYDVYADRHRAMIAYLQSLLATRTLLFVGVSLTDPNFRAIHQVIRRALGEYNRPAYLLDGRQWPTQVVRYWQQRGVRILEFEGSDTADGIARETAFIEQIAAGSLRGARGIHAANSLRLSKPPIEVQPLVDRIDALPAELQRVFAQMREEGLLKRDRSVYGDVSSDGSDTRSESGRWIREKARSLLDLALAVDALVPIVDDDLWIVIGDTLYDQRDSTGAIRAYNTVLRPGREHTVPDSPTVRRVYGNLARAYIREGHYARAEWLLRRCVFSPGAEMPNGESRSSAVFARLNREHLEGRPTDASEFAYVVSRRAERLIDGRHYAEAFDALREARHTLGPVLGETSHDKFKLGYFDLEQALMGRGWGQYERYAGQSGARRSNPKAYALNHLGKCYRLSAQLAPLLGKAEAPYYRKWAERYLREASANDPYLPYPYGHRFQLAADPHVLPDERESLLRVLGDELLVLARDGSGAPIAASFLAHLLAPSLNEPREVVAFRKRVAHFGLAGEPAV